jgi:hypothetical protein
MPQMGGCEFSFLKHSASNTALDIVALKKESALGRHQRVADNGKRLLLCEEWQQMTLSARLRMGVAKTYPFPLTWNLQRCVRTPPKFPCGYPRLTGS